MDHSLSLSVREIASLINGTICGNPDIVLKGICSLDETKNDALSFSTDKSIKKVKNILKNTNLGALLLLESLKDAFPDSPIPLIFVKDPFAAMIALVPRMCVVPETPIGISPSAIIDASAEIAADAAIGAFCVIGKNVKIDAGVVLHPHVVLYQGVHIGKNTIIHSGAAVREYVQIGANVVIQNGAIIGGDGFGYIEDPAIGLKAVPQVGNVVLADRVDIGANTCIDRATLGSTRVGIGSKIDNLCQIGHNVIIGMHSIICGMSGIGGSTKIGNQVVLGGATGVGDHITIVDGVRTSGRTGVSRNLCEKTDYAGHPAIKGSAWHRLNVKLMKLVEKKGERLSAAHHKKQP